MFRKMTAKAMTSSVVLVMLFAMLVEPALAATGSPILDKLAEVEITLYGAEKPGALLKRIKDIETDLGKPAGANDTVFVRVDNLSNFVSRGPESLVMKMNAIEWVIFQTLNSRQPLRSRLDQFEEKFSGEVRANLSVAQRINDLLGQIYTSSKLNTSEVLIPAGTEVKVKLITELSSAASKEGGPVDYQVAKDVIIGEKYAIPVGAQGKGKITSVKKAGPFGQAGQMSVEFGTVTTFDGTPIPLTYQKPTSSSASNQELAAGASLGGMVLFGPLGLAAGYLVKGSSETIPAGTELTLNVQSDVKVQALSLIPLQ